MLFAVTFKPRPGTTEDRDKRVLSIFSNWTPPAGYEFKSLYDYADGNGGIAIVEGTSAAALLEAHAPFAAYFEFELRPIVDAQEAIPLLQKAYAFRDAVR